MYWYSPKIAACFSRDFNLSSPTGEWPNAIPDSRSRPGEAVSQAIPTSAPSLDFHFGFTYPADCAKGGWSAFTTALRRGACSSFDWQV